MRCLGYILLMAAWLTTLTACQSMPAALVYTEETPDQEAVRMHIEFIDSLYRKDTARLDASFDKALAAFEKDRKLDDRLRLAWILGTHGHAHSNPWAARKHLSEALYILDDNSLLAALVRARIAQLSRNISLAEENRKAQEQIRALTDIEQSLEKKGNGKETP